ncbi:3-phenylpropionate MFS transporter [Paramagnetospirillum kuznetsovii]|uniref:3-phenylpropionate MFS transporter n=1 Tax=Paramagnetospirillum kuznetsovii TaxID=2053833 RepID=A0A364NX13_9PROT|nr:3-phenylpropionate MFS transporter [Paramagnetospirillum kuznetsovii]RAU21602.1 3-phenylpropionate MFS transporter [Paramagnetospirillum kuznetsovii]
MTGRFVAWRLAGFYGAIFAAVGIHIPFWPLWLADRGLAPSEIGILVAVGYLTRLIANPTVGHWVDHRGDRKRPMLILSMAAALLWLLFPFSQGFLPILVITVVAIFPFTGLMPVGDSLALMVTHSRSLDYGRVRLWGSLAFILSAVLVGRALTHWPVSVLPWLISGMLALTAVSCAALPDARVPIQDTPPPPVRPLLKSGIFLLFLLTAAFNQSAHTVYYAFATLHWKAAGLSDAAIGILWSEGVIAEVLLFAFSSRVVGRLGPARLLLAAALGGAVRWSVLGLTADPAMVALAQLLHAATFGCAHLGAMHFIARAVPPSLSVRAQGVYAALSVGLAPGLMTPASGYLYEQFGGGSFLAMAALSAGSALLGWRLLRCWDGGRLQPE